MNIQIGGLTIDRPAKEAFNFFIANSTFEYFNAGSYGFIIEATLHNTISPYKSFNSANFENLVDTLLIKFVGITENPDEVDSEWTFIDPNDKTICNKTTFIDEVNIQTEIYLKTIDYLEPICPAPVYAEVITNMDSQTLVTELIDSLDPDSELFEYLGNLLVALTTSAVPLLGIIGMEIAPNFRSLDEYESFPVGHPLYVTTPRLRLYENMARFQLLKMAVLTGYIHNDNHIANLLLNITYNNNYTGILGKILIIDFGFASKLTAQEIEDIKENIRNNSYVHALSLLYDNRERPDGLILSEYEDLYGWLSLEYSNRELEPAQTREQTNTRLTELNVAYESSIDARIHRFGARVPPIRLPLSSAKKNEFYNGMIDPTYREFEDLPESIPSVHAFNPVEFLEERDVIHDSIPVFSTASPVASATVTMPAQLDEFEDVSFGGSRRNRNRKNKNKSRRNKNKSRRNKNKNKSRRNKNKNKSRRNRK
jgi:hypothetical protein